MLVRSPACGPHMCCALAVPSARFLWTDRAPIATAPTTGSRFSCAGSSAGRRVSHAKTRELAGPLHLGTCRLRAVVHNNRANLQHVVHNNVVVIANHRLPSHMATRT